MPDNSLAPPNMPWLWQPNSPVGQPNGLGPPMLNYAAPPPDTSQGAGVAAAGQQAWQWLQDQRAESTRQGLLDPDTGLPTQKGVVQGLRDTAQGVMMGTTAPGETPGFSLEQVHPRTLRPIDKPDLGQPGNHAYSIKDPAGEPVGIVDTTWNPATGNLHIEDFQSEGGPNTLGPAAIRQLRSALLEQYPGVQSLSGLRISGATYAHTNSGSGPGRYASQSIQDVDPAAGTTAPGEMAPIEVSGGLMRGQSNIIRFREDADAIQSALPPVPEGHTRLWRGNRPDEVGTNQQFTSDLPGIALPFRESYGGPISYVDVPTNIVENHLQRDFAAPGVEYWLPPDIAKQAQAVHVTPRERPGALNYPSNPPAAGTQQQQPSQ